MSQPELVLSMKFLLHSHLLCEWMQKEVLARNSALARVLVEVLARNWALARFPAAMNRALLLELGGPRNQKIPGLRGIFPVVPAVPYSPASPLFVRPAVVSPAGAKLPLSSEELRERLGEAVLGNWHSLRRLCHFHLWGYPLCCCKPQSVPCFLIYSFASRFSQQWILAQGRQFIFL
jgi:hypothetical protein